MKGHKLDIAEITQIAEFGHNPAQLFEKPHKPFKAKVVKVVFDPRLDEVRRLYCV